MCDLDQLTRHFRDLLIFASFDPSLIGQITANTGAGHADLQEVSKVLLTDAANS